MPNLAVNTSTQLREQSCSARRGRQVNAGSSSGWCCMTNVGRQIGAKGTGYRMMTRALCAQLPETIDHLLICCSFSRDIWFRLLRKFGWEAVTLDPQVNNLAIWWIAARKRIPKENRRCFDSLVVLTCWLLWKERNDRTFDRRVRTIDNVLTWVGDEILAWFQEGFKHLHPAIAAFGRFSGREIVSV